MVWRVILLSFITIQLTGQVTIESYFDFNAESAALRASGIQNFFNGESLYNSNQDAFINRDADLGTQLTTEGHLKVYGLDSLKPNNSIGLNHYNYTGFYAEASVYKMVLRGNKTVKRASLENLKYKSISWQSLSFGRKYSGDGAFSFEPTLHLAWLNQASQFRNKDGSLENPNNGQSIDASYNYKLKMATAESNGAGILVDLKLKYLSPAGLAFTFELNHVGAFIQTATNVHELKEDTSYQGFNLVELINQEGANSDIQSHLFTGETKTSLIGAPATFRASLKKSYNKSWIASSKYEYERLNLANNYWFLTHKSKHKVSNLLSFRTHLGIGSGYSVRAGLGLNLDFTKHQIRINAQNLAGFAAPGLISGISLSVKYTVTL